MNVDPDSLAARGLASYVHTVAAELRVPRHAVHHEVSELSTAYLALHRRSPVFPELDLMLLWDERHGWSVALETAPADDPVVLAYLGGDVLAETDEVHRFVEDVIAGRCPGQPDAPPSLDAEQAEELVWRLAARSEDGLAA
ncbi:DUF6292 family protein [Kutzneria buriramensis]|uniref:DUF6292 domain-containing protein n=1 Tax=Kutzneria buriramensis TaxID=1045776 RepID=A0A3E0H246_9PSEU|nr:DUF6292 family protein [Kutzneria buriramensis]REH36343.1 hypothetical protein BCF44_116212 [Kutzneria buriramensis]